MGGEGLVERLLLFHCTRHKHLSEKKNFFPGQEPEDLVFM